jgi:hypothetical protein
MGPWFGGGYGQAWDPSYDRQLVVVDNEDDRERDRRVMAHIMSLPKAQRAAAYQKVFGKPAPEGALGAFEVMGIPGWAVVAGGAALAWFLFFRRKGRR